MVALGYRKNHKTYPKLNLQQYRKTNLVMGFYSIIKYEHLTFQMASKFQNQTITIKLTFLML